jgi:hypothetical protein
MNQGDSDLILGRCVDEHFRVFEVFCGAFGYTISCEYNPPTGHWAGTRYGLGLYEVAAIIRNYRGGEQ